LAEPSLLSSFSLA